VPELADLEVLDDREKAAQVVFVRMRKHHDIYLLHSSRPQIRRDDVFAGVPVAALECAFAGAALAAS